MFPESSLDSASASIVFQRYHCYHNISWIHVMDTVQHMLCNIGHVAISWLLLEACLYT